MDIQRSPHRRLLRMCLHRFVVVHMQCATSRCEILHVAPLKSFATFNQEIQKQQTTGQNQLAWTATVNYFHWHVTSFFTKCFLKYHTELPALQRYSLGPHLFWGKAARLSENRTVELHYDAVAWVRESGSRRIVISAGLCKLCAETERTIFETFGVEGSGNKRKHGSDTTRPASRLEPGTMSHGVNCFSCSRSR